jgi:hypothetical protein
MQQLGHWKPNTNELEINPTICNLKNPTNCNMETPKICKLQITQQVSKTLKTPQ